MTQAVFAVGPDLPPALGAAVRTALRGGDAGALVGELQRLLGTTVTGVLVYGSMAVPEAASRLGESDADLLVIVDEPASGGVYGRADGIDIDLHVQCRGASLDDPVSNLVYAGARVLFDQRAPQLAQWIAGMAVWMREHPDPWTEADRLRGRVWAERLVDRIARLGASDPAAAALHEARLLATLSQLHAQASGRYTTSISRWWSHVTAHDAAFASALSGYLARRAYPPDGAALRALVALLYRARRLT